jgi:hypothetical protein
VPYPLALPWEYAVGFALKPRRCVARPRSPAIAIRNEQIYALWKGGKSLSWLAEKFDRTPQQMGKVIAAFHPDIEDDDDRALHRGRLETLYEEVQEVVNSPGFKMAPNGRLAEGPDEEPLEDTGAKIEALKVKLQVLESMRKLDARDKPQARQLQVTHEIASSQAIADIARKRAEMEALARRAGQQAIPGEVIRELPAAGA